MADSRVRATQEELAAALTGALTAPQCLLLAQHLEGIEFFERQTEAVSQMLAECLQQY